MSRPQGELRKFLPNYFRVNERKIKHSACSSVTELTRSIYARDRGAVGPWDPLAPQNGKGKGKGIGRWELGSRKEKKNSSNDLWRKTYFTNYDIGM